MVVHGKGVMSVGKRQSHLVARSNGEKNGRNDYMNVHKIRVNSTSPPRPFLEMRMSMNISGEQEELSATIPCV